MVEQHEVLSKHQVPEDCTKHRGHGLSTGSSTMMTLLGEESEDESSDSDNDRNAIAVRTQVTAEYDMYVKKAKEELEKCKANPNQKSYDVMTFWNNTA